MCGHILHAMMSCTGVLLILHQGITCLMPAVFACNGRELYCASSATLSPSMCIMPAAASDHHDQQCHDVFQGHSLCPNCPSIESLEIPHVQTGVGTSSETLKCSGMEVWQIHQIG